MNVNAPRARASFLTLLLVLGVGCSAASTPVQQAGTTPSAEHPEHDHGTHDHGTHEHSPATSPTGTAPAPSVEPQASATPAPPSPELAAYERAKPILEKYCASCHTKGGAATSKEALEHFSMDGYPFGGHHANEIGAVVRKSLGASGSKPTMPRGKPGVVKGDDLAAILAWADAFDAAHPPAAKEQGKHQHAQHKH
jgi:mono/diheme cytochrome c family protein